MATFRSTRPITLAGFTIIFMTFGVFGGWATVARIDSAVIAPGIVALEGSRKTIQHLEGGIVESIAVEEADRVSEGDVLLRLTSVEAGSNLDVIATRLAVARIAEARLLAERNLEESFTPPDDIEVGDSETVAHALDDQADVFEDRRSILQSEADILSARMAQSEQQVEGLEQQRAALDKRLANYEEMLGRMRDGGTRGLVQKNVISQREDDLIQIEADLGGVVSQIAQARNEIAGTELQILQVRQQYRERANRELEEIRAELGDLVERRKVAGDVLERTAIRAPGQGTIQNLQVHTVGAVVRPGEDLMELVPENENLVINARVATTDIDSVAPGLTTEIRFPAIQGRLTPIMLGTVESVSSDVITPDSPNEQPYFLARIDVSEADVPEPVRDRIAAGMPVESVIVTGERRVVDYLASPLVDAVRKSMVEE